jgi:hypothetical protein
MHRMNTTGWNSATARAANRIEQVIGKTIYHLHLFIPMEESGTVQRFIDHTYHMMPLSF